MTVPSTARRAGPYTGNGSTTTFSFTFKTFAAGDLLVTRMDALGLETTLVLNSDYSVSLNVDQDASPGGTITYPITGSPLPAGQKLTIVGDLEYEQTTDLLGGGSFNARVIEDTFDRTVIQIQQLEERLDRALLVPVNSTANVQLPNPEPNELIGWDSTGSNLANYSLSQLATGIAYGTMRFDTFTGNGSQTQFALTEDPAALANLDVSISGVTQIPGTDYTLTSATIVFTSAPPNGAIILARYGRALPVSGPIDSSAVTHVAAGLGAVVRTAQSKMRDVVSVKDFGAVGDGVADDTAAIQATIDYCLANAKSLYVPTGKYRLTAQVNIPVYSNVFERDLIIYGEGMGSQFIVDHAGTGFYVTCLPSYSTYQSEFRDLYFTTGTTSPDKIIHNVGAINTLIRDCHFRSATVGTGCVVNDNAYGLTLQGCVFWQITGTCAFYALVSNLSTYSYVNSIIDCEFSIVTKGVEMQGCNAFLVSNTVFQECDVGFYANPDVHQVTAFNITFDTCWFERNTTWDIQLDSDLNYWCEASIRNCQFSGFDPTYQAKIQLEQKSKVTIEGTPAGNTVVVHGADEAAVVLIRATNFVQSGVYAWTSIDPVGNVLAKTYKSLSGVYAAPASGATVTLTTLPNVTSGTWLVAAMLDGSTNPAAFHCVGVLSSQATTAIYTPIKTATDLTVSVSGLNLQGNQTSGGVYSITWSLTRLS